MVPALDAESPHVMLTSHVCTVSLWKLAKPDQASELAHWAMPCHALLWSKAMHSYSLVVARLYL